MHGTSSNRFLSGVLARRKDLLAIILLLGMSIAFLLPGLGKMAVVRQKELRVTLTARDMAQGGSWLVPRFEGQPRLRKPPLMYWTVASVFKLAGTTDSPLVARLPNAAMGAALILAIYLAGRGLIGRKRAFFGACACASSLLFIQHARLAETDIPLCLFTFFATVSGYVAVTGRHRAAGWLGLGAFAGLGFLVKGPAAPAMPLAALIVFSLTTGAYRRKLLSPGLAAAIGVCALIAVPWYIAIQSGATHGVAGGAVQSELNETFLIDDHPGPFYYYLYNLPFGILPWGLLLPFAVWSLWKTARHHKGGRFLLCWFAATFVVLSCVKNKQFHYTVLLLPQTALLLGAFLVHGLSRLQTWKRRLTNGYITGFSALLILAGAAMVIGSAWTDQFPNTSLPGWLLASFSLALWLGTRRKQFLTRFAGALAATALCLYIYLFGVYGIHHDSLIPEFGAAARPYTEQAAKVWAVGPHSAVSPVQFYIGKLVTQVPDVSSAWDQAAPRDAIIVCGDRKHPVTKSQALGAPILDMQKQELRFLLYVKPQGDIRTSAQ